MQLVVTGRAVRLSWRAHLSITSARSKTFEQRPLQRRYQSSGPQLAHNESQKVVQHDGATLNPSSLVINGHEYATDAWTNVPPTILSYLPRKLHLLPSHPVSITRQLIESCFPTPTYTYYNNLDPIVSVYENFDSLGFPADHPGRDRSDTYYLNKDTVLRTHTSAHEPQLFRDCKSDGYTLSADVYRRDAIDRSHYPVFHQMEVARMWDRRRVPGGDIASAVWKDVEKLPKHDLEVEDPNPAIHAERNPLQAKHHTAEEAEAIAAHLKRSLEGVVVELFTRAKRADAARKGGNADTVKPLKVRWVETTFPFTSPSYELEVFWQGDWLEVLGCGVTKQDLYINAGVPHKLGWAVGIGLERIAMLLYSIPDIRLFWSKDARFLDQFSTMDAIKQFEPFSKYPACYKDVSFWLRSSSSSAGGGTKSNTHDFHENDAMEIVREVGGDLVEDVKLIDTFTSSDTGRKSLCYRINYRSLERTLTNEEADRLHGEVREKLVEKLGVELR